MIGRILLAGAIVVVALALPNGPPSDACEDRTPQHDVESSTEDCPFMIVALPWEPGKFTQVGVMTVDQNDRVNKFRGFMASVTLNDEAIGTMRVSQQLNRPKRATIKTICDDTAMAHADSIAKSEVLFEWMAPADLDPTSELKLRLTIVGKEIEEQWVDCNVAAEPSFFSVSNSEDIDLTTDAGEVTTTSPTASTTRTTASTTTLSTDTTTTTRPTTPEPTTPEPTTPEPNTPEPTTPEPTTPEPTTPQPTTPQPTTPQPTTPTTPEPTTPQPTTPEPTTPEPTTPQPTTPEPTTPEPTTPEQTTPEPTAPEQTTPEPATPEPVAQDPATPEPTAPERTTPEPTTPEPTTPQPEVRKESEKVQETDVVNSYLEYSMKMNLKHKVMSNTECMEGATTFKIIPGTDCTEFEMDKGLKVLTYKMKCPMGKDNQPIKFDPRVCACAMTNDCPI